MDPREDRSLIAFFDLETTPPPRRVILEIGAILMCPRTLVEKYNYHTFVRPDDPYITFPPAYELKGITFEEVASAPSFSDVANDVFHLLHGRVWAGHNIIEFDEPELRKAFEKINRQPPKPKEVIDTYPLLDETFGRRADSMKLADLASYFGLEQKHRSLDDVRLNLEVLKNCAATLFLETQFPILLSSESWIAPNDVNIDSINASLTPFSQGHKGTKIQIFHKDVQLKLRCSRLQVRYGISTEFKNVSVVVDAPPRLCEILEMCEGQAHSYFQQSGSRSNWNDLITSYGQVPNIRLRIPTEGNGNHVEYITDLCVKKSGGQEITLNGLDDRELERLFIPGDFIEAFFLVDTYDYGGHAGVRLVAEKLVSHS